jgi:hypothetical protein
MKLLAGLFAATMAIDCPNDMWTLNEDGTACIPAPGTVGITCNPTEMTISFDAGHLYVNMDPGHADLETSAASVGDCTPVLSSEGDYVLTIPLDGCGTTVSQADGAITFANTIFGDDDALTIDGIITTEKLQLDVACSYSDEFDILVSDIGIEAAGHTLGDMSDAGEMDSEFSLDSYSDAAFTEPVSSENNVIIGQPVYNRVSVSGAIPSNVDFVVKACTAMDAPLEADATYDILKNGCLDNLIATTELSDNLRGSSVSDVDFSFNGFTFESNSDTLYVECKIVLCAVDEFGDFINPDCGFDDSDLATTCAAAESADNSALGYSVATGLGAE